MEPRALHAHSRPPPMYPRFTGSQNRCVPLTTGAQYRHSAPPQRPPAFCPANLPHFYAAYGRLILVFKPSARASNGAGTKVPFRSRRPGGCDSRSIRTQEPGGRRWNRRSRESRTPGREERTPTERGVHRGVAPYAPSLGTFSGARESTPPVGAGPDKPKGLPELSGKRRGIWGSAPRVRGFAGTLRQSARIPRRNIPYLLSPYLLSENAGLLFL